MTFLRHCFTRLVVSLLTLCSLSLITLNASAFDPEDAIYSIDDIDVKNQFLSRASAKYTLSPHSPDLMGEQFDLTTGSVKFERVDAAIQGNSALEVAYRTSFSIQAPEYEGWHEELPRIEVSYLFDYENGHYKSLAWDDVGGNYCTGNQQLPTLSVDYREYSETGWGSPRTASMYPKYYSPGTMLVVPGKTRGKLLLNDVQSRLGLNTTTYKYVTKDKWRLSCYTSTNGVKGFKADSPAGLTYYFDILNAPKFDGADDIDVLNSRFYKKRIALLASKIEDRFGNFVTYGYETTTRGARLSSMTANDGRSIVVNHPSTAITTVTTNSGRVWTYTETEPTESDHQVKVHLDVERPDGKHWIYDLFHTEDPEHDEEDEPCDTPRNSPDFGSSMTVTHPDGTLGTFVFSLVENGQTFTPSKSYVGSNPYIDDYIAPPDIFSACTLTYSLRKKTLSGAGFDNMEWNYSYSGDEGFHSNQSPSQINNDRHGLTFPVPSNIDDPDNDIYSYNYKTVKITQPDSSSVKYYINRDTRSPNQNKIEATEFIDFDGTTVLKQVKKYFEQGSGYGTVISDNGANRLLDKQNPKLTKIEIEQNGFTYTTELSDFDLYDKAQKIFAENTLLTNKKRYSQYTYYNHSSHWLLGLPKTSKIASTEAALAQAPVYRETNYYSGTALPNQTKVMGVWQSKAQQYHGDGNLKKMIYNGTDRYELFENYKLGQAQKITLPCGTTNGCSTANGSNTNTLITLTTIDNNGQLQNTTDFKGNKVNYQYNPMGLLTLIDPADSLVANTVITYQTVSAANDGISGSGVVAGMYKQTITQGDYEQRLYHDTMLRPVFTREKDITDSPTARYSRASFNYRNKPDFTSFSNANISASIGTNMDYDALGRVISMTSKGGTNLYNYSVGNSVSVTNPRGKVTTTDYLAYGSPAQSNALTISAPESVITNLTYNLFGQIETITQGGITENRIYDSLQQLCKVNRPETGNTAYGYNSRRQMNWYAEGANGSTTSCDAVHIGSGKSVGVSYNNLSERDGVIYPDASGDVSYFYDDNGNLETLIAGNVSHVYGYNNQDRLVLENLEIVEGSLTKTLNIEYGYNSLGHQISQTYPNGNIVDFAVNALGQATSTTADQATQQYAINALYYGNGLIKSFTFGNGITHTTSLNAHLTPDRMTDRLVSGGSAMDLQYGYDVNQNITSLVNHVNGNYSLSNLSYDGLDRLLTTTGGAGIGSSAITYDTLGNIQTYNSLNSNLTYFYDTNNRLDRVTGTGSRSKTYTNFDYDDRGNVIDNSFRTLNFNRANQLSSSEGNTYVYDGYNRRVKQSDASGDSYSMYTQGGRLLYRETNVDSVTGIGQSVNYIFLGRKLIAKEGLSTDTSSSLQHYKPYGETIEAPKDDVGYTGHKFDTDLGLSYMQARYYDPVIGRFYSNDPIEFRDVHSFNRYAYANNNPYKYIDPDGRDNYAIHAAKARSTGQSIGELSRCAGCAGAGIMMSEVIGLKDIADSITAMNNGDFSGAGIKLAEVVLKPLKIAKKLTVLYQKLDKDGKHLKYGIAKAPEKTRYTKKELDGGRLKILATGEKKDMLKLERNLHETMPIGSEEGQKVYDKIQAAKGLKTRPYGE